MVSKVYFGLHSVAFRSLVLSPRKPATSSGRSSLSSKRTKLFQSSSSDPKTYSTTSWTLWAMPVAQTKSSAAACAESSTSRERSLWHVPNRVSTTDCLTEFDHQDQVLF